LRPPCQISTRQIPKRGVLGAWQLSSQSRYRDSTSSRKNGEEETFYAAFPCQHRTSLLRLQDTDYEFALNPCKDGGTEIFCLAKVGALRKHYYPHQPKSPTDGGPVGGEAKLVCKDNVIECAIPWSAMPEVQKAIQAGRTIKFTFRSNEGGAMELAAGRSISKINPMTLHNDWSDHWANELEFGVERPSVSTAGR
jgi:hypothetical protein